MGVYSAEMPLPPVCRIYTGGANGGSDVCVLATAQCCALFEQLYSRRTRGSTLPFYSCFTLALLIYMYMLYLYIERVHFLYSFCSPALLICMYVCMYIYII